jgi:hypothetical protein
MILLIHVRLYVSEIENYRVLRSTFFNCQTVQKKVRSHIDHSIVIVLIISIIFAKETMFPSFTSSAPDSSQYFTPGVRKNLNYIIKPLIVDR